MVTKATPYPNNCMTVQTVPEEFENGKWVPWSGTQDMVRERDVALARVKELSAENLENEALHEYIEALARGMGWDPGSGGLGGWIRIRLHEAADLRRENDSMTRRESDMIALLREYGWSGNGSFEAKGLAAGGKPRYR